MVAGRLQEKNGFYYIVLSYTDSAGKRRQPWIGTGLPVKGNKKRAEKMLAETRKDFTIPKGQVSELSPDMAFSDYMRYWLKMMRTAVTETTYSSYCFNVEKHIIPYFEPLGVTLAGLQPRQIQSFYLHEAETLKNTSILRFHANLHKALKYAVRIDLIASNPVDKVDRPKPQAFMASYYSAEEMEKLFEAAQGHKLELIIQLAAFYGLRRAEVMGLRWEAIDFEAKTLTIRHIVTSTRIDGKKILVEADRAKTKSSLRTLPLVDPIAERLKAVKEQQEETEETITHLESIMTELDIARKEEDLLVIRQELSDFGYMKEKRSGKKGKPIKKSKPLHFISSDGYDIFVGKNNYQNDELTFKTATGNDWWFHAKNMPGSHVIVKTNGEEPPIKTFEEAGSLAAYFSKGKGADKVEIDYTQKKNVKKPNGGKPGFVVYYTNYSLMASSHIEGIRCVNAEDSVFLERSYV